MKKAIAIVAMTQLIYSCSNQTMKSNPFIDGTKGVLETPAFDKIEIEHYKPAFESAIKIARTDIDQIASSTQEPTFENTIEALERAAGELTEVSNIFFNLNQADTDPQMEQIAMDVTPAITEYSNDVALNETLFARVKTVYDKRESLGLTDEQMRLLEKSYKGFTRGGALLEGDKKQRYREVTERLSQLALEFSQNSLAATNDYTLHITDSTQLDGLMASTIEAAKEQASSKGLEGWVFTLQTPSYVPFMQHSKNRELREQMYKAYNSRCVDGGYDNREKVREIVNLRLEKANLLGYATHADYVLEERMAKNKQTVNEFLSGLLSATKSYAVADVKQVADFAASNGFDGELMPWDFSYWAERLKQQRYSLDDEQLKPYFSLESVLGGIFTLTDKLYGLKFTPAQDIEVYHPDVTAYKVTDDKGRYMGVLYLDFFPRESKRSGAWMTSFRELSRDANGQESRPFVSVVCNFTKPTSTTPSLLTFDEVTTMLHEFGHALHGLLAEGNYASVTGTNVAWDFVELPSQIMENWATESEFLTLWAKHYQTGEPISEELITKIVESKNYLSGYGNVRQLTFGINDMAWHSITEPFEGDVIEFERESTKECMILPVVEGMAISPAMGHIFPGGYSAGYYSYKWAEVLEADAFSMFKEEGIFSKEVAQSFKANILSKGSIGDAMDNYVAFRGRKAEPDALLVKLGLKK